MTVPAALYLRISQDQTGNRDAWRRQAKECESVFKRLGWTLVETYRDVESASKDDVVREDYERMRRDWEARKFEKIVVYDADRFVRQPSELEVWIRQTRKQRRHLVVASPQVDYDLTTDAGRLQARIKATFAAGEVERKSQRQVDAAKQRAADGEPPLGTRLFGYESDGRTLRESEARYVPIVFERFVAGLPLRAIARELDAAGVPTRRGGSWSPSSIRTILQNARYAGRTWYLGEPLDVEKVSWPTLVDGPTFDAAQAVLRDPTRLKHSGTERRRLGSGLYLCGICGGPMQQTGTVYACIGHMSRTMRLVDEFVEAVFIARLSRADIAEALAEGAEDKARLAEIRAGLRQAMARKTRFLDDYFGHDEGEGLTLQEFRKATAMADAEIAELEREERKLVRPDVAGLLGPDPADRWGSASVHVKQAVIRALCTVTLAKTGRKGPNQRKMFDADSVRFDWHDGSAA